MKKQLHFTDEGLVLKKSSLRDNDRRVVLLTRNFGKKTLTAFGVRKITSRRLSHLETGSVIRLSWREDGDFAVLEETELRFAHSRIKESKDLLTLMYDLLYIVHRLLPDSEPAPAVYALTLKYLKKIYTQGLSHDEFGDYVSKLLVLEGFASHEEVKKRSFDPFKFTESLLN